jgi:hypothetical protein
MSKSYYDDMYEITKDEIGIAFLRRYLDTTIDLANETGNIAVINFAIKYNFQLRSDILDKEKLKGRDGKNGCKKGSFIKERSQ